MKKVLLILIIFCLTAEGFCQDSISYSYSIKGGYEEQGRFDQVDSLAMMEVIRLRLWREGYFAYSISVNGESIDISTGSPLKWLALEPGNVPEGILEAIGYKAYDFRGQPLDYEQFMSLYEKLLAWHDNHGFPFASIALDSIRQEDYSLEASFDLSPGPQITFDSLRVNGNARIKTSAWSRRLGLQYGDPYSEQKVNQAASQLNNKPYFVLQGPIQRSFQNSQATLYLPINNRRINTIDGIIGFLPNETEENKMLITGQFDLEIYNPTGRGREYALHWQRLSQYSQTLEINALEPMIFKTPIDLSIHFGLLKQDTTFINRDFILSFGYPLYANATIEFFSRWQSGDLLSVPEITDSMDLPDILDYRYHNYGLKLSYVRLDNRILPRSGISLEGEAGIGNKEILQNTQIPEEYYEGVDQEAIQAYSQVHFNFYSQLRPQLSAYIGLHGGYIEGNNLLRNDMFRLGGLQTIRGFNENFFFTNRYVYANFEPRFYFENESYFLLFTDMGLLGSKSITTKSENDQVISFGAGLNLSTQGGMFRFLYGVGRSADQKIGFNYGKIHFGYIGRF
ncbi:membrane protein [Echinicola pacifica]|uniref:Membrane protein n=1 Tax=Echinicola pacifica TaxID=346377 RepID=A0A918PWJ5_9BACT|nr:POTRA domain-containing protein [Echinicola pacifica]GGZ23103.1 membrane protein [Echinicola pacifica]